MGNTMFNKTMYKCAICNSVYDTVADRMKCEAACIKKEEEEAKRLAEEKKKEERNERKKEVEVALKNANELLQRYIEDYGSYDFYRDMSEANENYEFFWPSRLLHDWLF